MPKRQNLRLQNLRLQNLWLLLVAIAGSVILTTQLLWTVPANATAAQPPYLVKMRLGGKPVDMLFITRSSDTVLVRCYPGFAPTLSVGKKQPDVSTTGTLKCQPEN